MRSLGLKTRLMILITSLMTMLCIAAGIYIVIRAQGDIRGEVRSASGVVERYLGARLQLAAVAWRSEVPGARRT